VRGSVAGIADGNQAEIDVIHTPLMWPRRFDVVGDVWAVLLVLAASIIAPPLLALRNANHSQCTHY